MNMHNKFGIECYPVTDVLLLADLIEKCLNVSLQYCQCDIAHLFTGPGLAYPAAMKQTGVKLELIRVYKILLMFEQHIQKEIKAFL